MTNAGSKIWWNWQCLIWVRVWLVTLSHFRLAPTSTQTTTFTRNTEVGFLHSCQGGIISPITCWHIFLSQPRICEHHRQPPWGASERSAWSPWLRGCRGADGEAGDGQVLPDRARACQHLGRWQHLCSALHRLNCDCSKLVFMFSEQLAVSTGLSILSYLQVLCPALKLGSLFQSSWR